MSSVNLQLGPPNSMLGVKWQLGTKTSRPPSCISRVYLQVATKKGTCLHVGDGITTGTKMVPVPNQKKVVCRGWTYDQDNKKGFPELHVSVDLQLG